MLWCRPMTAHIGLRERKKVQTREELLGAAWRLFADKGYDATTVDEIAEVAEVSRRTLFRYFPSKESLVFYDTDEALERFQAALDDPAGADGSAFGAVRHALEALAAEYTDDRDGVVLRQRIVNASPALIAAERTVDLGWENAIATALLERTPMQPDREHWARTLAGAIFGLVRATLREWFAQDGRPDLVAMGTESMDLLVRGFGLNEDD